MNKKDRDIIFNKYGGRCAYCGCELIKGWHVDHIEPVNRLQKRKEGYYKHKETGVKITQDHLPEKWFIDYIYVRPGLVYDKMQNPERDTLDNSMPSCHSCNNYKNTFDLETFRKQIGLLISRLNKYVTQYKIVKRYGLIQETTKPVIFYFETVQSQQEIIKTKKTKIMDAEEIKYMEWMHDLTTLGYTQEVVFLVHDSDLVQKYYDDGKTPAEALGHYMKVKGIEKINQ